MNTLQKTFGLLTPSERKSGFGVLILMIGMAVLETAGVASVMPFLAVLGNPEMIERNPLLNSLFGYGQKLGVRTPDDFLILLGLGSLMLIVVSAGYRIFTHYIIVSFIQMRRHAIGVRLLQIYLRQPYTFFLDRHSSDLSKIILSEVDQLSGVIDSILQMIVQTLILAFIVILLLTVSPLLTITIAGLISSMYLVVVFIVKNRLTILGQKRMHSNEERFKAASEALGGIKDIKLLGREQKYLGQFSSPSHRMSKALVMLKIFKIVPSVAIEAFIFGVMLLLTLSLMILEGGVLNNPLGEILPILGVYAFAAIRMKPAMNLIYDGFASLRSGQIVVDSLYADLHPDPTPEQLPVETVMPLVPEDAIVVKDVSYRYPHATNPALINMNFEIPVGSTIGLVGSTGAGKTTLVDLLLGLLRPTAGEISVDGVLICDSRTRAWQQSLGYVPQDIFLIDASVAENIAFGISKEQIDHVQVERCAKMAQVHDFIMNDLPACYETPVGERGVRLSGGQRQRIGIARALYHNPQVLVLDEATSALDTITEEAVMASIKLLSHQKTIVIIAHRLSTVKYCDRIILLEKGMVQAQGTFDELMESSTQFKLLAKHK